MARMPQVTARELLRFLKSQGFVEDRQSGSHIVLRNTAKRVTVTVPVHIGSDVHRSLAIKILRGAGFSVDAYLKLR
jgi:predicted RNA binding protein YcfA (HicA-like mRNA interferase family)